MEWIPSHELEAIFDKTPAEIQTYLLAKGVEGVENTAGRWFYPRTEAITMMESSIESPIGGIRLIPRKEMRKKPFYLDDKELAEIFDCGLSYIRTIHENGYLPKKRKRGSREYYLRDEVIKAVYPPPTEEIAKEIHKEESLELLESVNNPVLSQMGPLCPKRVFMEALEHCRNKKKILTICVDKLVSLQERIYNVDYIKSRLPNGLYEFTVYSKNAIEGIVLVEVHAQ